jgi:hypothetical protein
VRPQSPSPIPREDKIAAVEEFDNFAELRNILRFIADEQNEIGGIPMPLEGQQLIINPKFSRAEALGKIGAPAAEESADGARLVNSWWSQRHRCDVVVVEEADGRRWATRVRPRSPIDMVLDTVMCSVAWGIEQEANAIQLLGTLIKPHLFKTYLLTGMFVETSRRSGITYIFRKLRPTIALSPNKSEKRLVPLCTLCLHPIAYYHGTWAGAMCPTDDVVAHLMLMRGDEAMFWRRANQHSPWRPESGMV